MTEQLNEAAVLYLLDQMTAEESASFATRLAAGDADVHRALAGANEEVAAALILLAEPVKPPPGLKERLLKRIGQDPYPGLYSKRVHEQGPWKPSRHSPGVFYKKLYFDEETGLVTTLVKMEPGAHLDAHTHVKTEQCLILEGDLRYSEEKVYRAGDFTWALGGSLDPALYTVEGNLLLIIGGR